MSPDALYRVPNNAGWYRDYAVLRRAGGDSPWRGAPAWAPGALYAPGDARVVDGDLFLVRPDIGVPFTSANTFAGDVDNAGARWIRVGRAAGYAAVPVDLTGASLVMALKAIDGSGAVTDPRPKLLCGTADGCVSITNARLGGVSEAISVARARKVPPGSYAFDLVATWPGGRVERLRYGPIIVLEGSAP